MRIEIGGEPHGPLVGVHVLDLSSIVSGPMCAQILGDFGADVVKVESPIGDTVRYLGAERRNTITGLFAQYNRNKRSVVLDLKTESGKRALFRLVRNADVVLENYRAGVADRMGIGYEAMRAQNPGVIYVAISGYGPDGPYADQPAYDMVIQGMSGFSKLLGTPERPRLISNLVADKTSGLTAAYALLAALYERERNGGKGQRIDVPMIDAFSSFVLSDAFAPQTFGDPPPPRTTDEGVYRAWETKDGHVALLVIEDRHYAALCRTVEREDLISEELFATLAARLANLAELFAVFEVELRGWTTAELVERAHRFGVPLGPINDIEQFMENPQVRSNETVFDLETEQGTSMRLFASAPRFSNTPSSVRRPPPELGAHTREVLREAGMSDAEIDELG